MHLYHTLNFHVSLDLFVFFPLIYLFIHVPAPQCLSHRAFAIQCALGRARSPSSFVFFHCFPDYSYMFVFHINFSINLYYSIKKTCWCFIGIGYLSVKLRRADIFIMLSHSTQTQGRSLNLFKSTFASNRRVLLML